MTEKKAVKIAMDLWKWLAENPGKYKKDWPQYQKHGIANFNAECPLCVAYDMGCKTQSGKKCPLDWYKYCNIGHPYSAYHEWKINVWSKDKEDQKECIKAATIIWERLAKFYKKNWGKK